MIKTLVTVLATFIVTVAIAPAASAQWRSEREGRRVSARLRAEGRRVMRDSERGWRYRADYHDSYYDGYYGRRSVWNGRRDHHYGDLGNILDVAERVAIPLLAHQVGREMGRHEGRMEAEARDEDFRKAQYTDRSGSTEEDQLTDENGWRILNLTPTKAKVFRRGVAIPVIPGYSQMLPLEPNEEGTIPSASGISAKIRCHSGRWVSAEVEPDTQNENTLIIILPALGACR